MLGQGVILTCDRRGIELVIGSDEIVQSRSVEAISEPSKFLRVLSASEGEFSVASEGAFSVYRLAYGRKMLQPLLFSVVSTRKRRFGLCHGLSINVSPHLRPRTQQRLGASIAIISGLTKNIVMTSYWMMTSSMTVKGHSWWYRPCSHSYTGAWLWDDPSRSQQKVQV